MKQAKTGSHLTRKLHATGLNGQTKEKLRKKSHDMAVNYAMYDGPHLCVRQLFHLQREFLVQANYHNLWIKQTH